MQTNSFFSKCQTVEEVKTLYRRLAMKYHPDRGGDNATMQEVNRQYQTALKSCHGQTSTGSDGKEHVYTYNEKTEAAVMSKVSAFCGLGMVSVEIMLIGSWIWISGETKPWKDQLKALGCKWHGRRRCWYWHLPQKWRSRQNRGSLEDLAHKYGYKAFDSEESDRMAAA